MKKNIEEITFFLILSILVVALCWTYTAMLDQAISEGEALHDTVSR